MRKSLYFLTFSIFFSIISIPSKAQSDDLGESMQKLHKLFTMLQTNYVDNYDTKKSTETAIKAILKDLDPHSNYLTADELKNSNEPLQGSFEGVGISYNNDDDTLIIVSTIQDGPADRAGVCPGDKVIYVGDSLVAGIDITAIRISNLLRGKKGSDVTLRLLREDVKDTLTYKIRRDKIPIESVTSTYMVNSEIGYVKVIRFGSQTVADLKAALKKLKKQGMEYLILDLRGNPGGYLHAAVEMVDEFVSKDELIVYTEGKESKRKNYFTKNGGIFEDGRLAVLIDEGSASASEIVSGAVQDLDRGVIVGRRSFGKGLVQNTYYFTDGSAARITTARYYTPTGRSIQRPYNEGKDKYYEELKKRFERGELTTLDSIHLPDSLKFNTKNGRTVYGGGGIMPDIFVPLDSLSKDSIVEVMNKKNLLYRFAVRYTNRNRKDLIQNFPSFDKFRNAFNPSRELLDQFSRFCVEKGQPIIWSELNPNVLKYSEIMLKANIARLLWDDNEFMAISNERDPAFMAAVEALEKDKLKEMVLAK